MPRTVTVLFYVDKPVFNLFAVEEFPNFDKYNSSLLRRNLLINQIEIVSSLGPSFRTMAIFHQFDISAERLDELERFEQLEMLFYEEGNESQVIREILEDSSESKSLILIVNPFVMGLKPEDYQNIIRQVDLEDNIVFVCRSQNGYISAVALNYFETNQSNLMLNMSNSYDKFLKQVLMLDSRPITTTGAIVIRSTHDFKLLYEFLSGKESIPACSFEMHDRFTELFVEYKELL
ncbi:hypothetical protein MASR1M107_17280 [Ignavibacteriales bacterium]